MSDNFKKLTGKNPKDFEPVAYSLINKPDVELFAELVQKDDFLFDFVKQNVANRLEKACNNSNYINLLNFLKYYSTSYEDFIVSTLVKFADEDLTDKMLDLFENGTDEEKTYCAKFFSFIHDPLAMDLLQQNAFTDNGALSSNCAAALAMMGETSCYEKALEMVRSDDCFTQLDGVKFLTAYGDKNAISEIVKAAKKSTTAENIAAELLYLTDLFELYEQNQNDSLYIANLIINGLGEILELSQVFDFKLYEFLQMLVETEKNSINSVVLLNSVDKFDTLTENDEYLFDETKETKQEILDIKKLLLNIDLSQLYIFADRELNQDSLFVYTALDFTENEEKVRNLLGSTNPTVVLKALETLKQFDSITNDDKNVALDSVKDENIKSVIMAM